MNQAAVATLAALLLGACAAQSPRAPAVAPAATPPSSPAEAEALPPSTLPPPTAPGWEDQALTAGDWRYAAGPAPLAEYRAGEGVRFALRCDSARGRVLLSRSDGRGPLTVRTSYSTRTLDGPEAALAASDTFLDAIAYSRGRFAVEAPGEATLVLPTWPEAARVIEECRP